MNKVNKQTKMSRPHKDIGLKLIQNQKRRSISKVRANNCDDKDKLEKSLPGLKVAFVRIRTKRRGHKRRVLIEECQQGSSKSTRIYVVKGSSGSKLISKSNSHILEMSRDGIIDLSSNGL